MVQLLEVAKGLEYLHSRNIEHGRLKGVSSLPDPFSISISLPLVCNRAIVLILWWQSNIVIDNDGRARLADYGLNPIYSNSIFVHPAGDPETHEGFRWLAPEVTYPQPGAGGTRMRFKCKVEVFAFRMVIVEVFTGKVPFYQESNSLKAGLKILDGDRPERPRDAGGVELTDGMWGLLCRCWSANPASRPTMKKVVQGLQTLLGRGRVGAAAGI